MKPTIGCPIRNHVPFSESCQINFSYKYCVLSAENTDGYYTEDSFTLLCYLILHVFVLYDTFWLTSSAEYV